MAERGTLVYVHGASDRSAQVDDHVARIEQQLARTQMDFDVIASRWGEALGADLSRIELAIPDGEVRTAAAASTAPAPTALRAHPPLQPLRELVGTAPRRRGGRRAAVVAERQSDELLEICRAQVGAPGESITLEDGTSMPMAAACRLAATEVAGSAEYAAAKASNVPELALVDAVGRAVASTVAATAAAPLDVARTVEVRIAEAVLGAALATIFAGYLGIDVGPDLKRWATDVLVPHRARLVREAGLGPADILLYQRHPDRIRSFVLETIALALERGGPVVALGNSMGGIILVEALAQPAAPRPDLLVTVGSQAPLLQTFGALDPLGPPNAPTPFQPWLNIYDHRDLLGFAAGRVWPDQAGIVDHGVDLGVGFPDAHGARYLSSADVFEAIRRQLAPGAPGRARRWRLSVRRLSPAARFLLGATAANSYVELDGQLRAQLGRFDLSVPLTDISGWRRVRLERDRGVIGLLRALLRGVAALGSGSEWVRVDLGRPARWWLFELGALELALEDGAGFGEALADRLAS